MKPELVVAIVLGALILSGLVVAFISNKRKSQFKKTLDIAGFPVTIQVEVIRDTDLTPLGNWQAFVLGKPHLGSRNVIAASSFGQTAKESVELIEATLTRALNEDTDHVRDKFAFAFLTEPT